jgi:PelA/Pel-15E family pectate lyase
MLMKRLLLKIIGFAIALSACLPSIAAIIGTNSEARPLTMERISRLPAKEQSAWKEYLERSERQFAADKEFLVSELRRHTLSSSTPAPKGEKQHRLPLNQSASWYAGSEALGMADSVVSFQTPAGGWCKGVNMTAARRAPGGQIFGDSTTVRIRSDVARISDWNFIGTFDNTATTTQLRFLAKVIAATHSPHAKPYREAFQRGMDYILAAQFPNGGWPQVWPLSGEYHDAITYNDGAMVSVLELLHEVAAGQNDFAFTATKLRQQAAAAVERGVDCILKTQIVLNGKHTLWCQQHDALDLAPTAARKYEMPSLCSAESAGILAFLMTRPKPTPAMVHAIHAGCTILKETKISGFVWQKVGAAKRLVATPEAEPLWARYYALNNQRPVFGDRDKSIRDDVHEVSEERRNGYSWFTTGPSRVLEQYARWQKSHPKPTSD